MVGTGTPGSCTEAALDAALAGGGNVTFNCGGPVTIVLTSTKFLTVPTAIDGGGNVTLDGNDTVRLFDTPNDPGVSPLSFSNLTLSHGHAAGAGGAIFILGLISLTIANVTFEGNRSTTGGAVHANGPLLVSNSTFTGNYAGAAGNGGAIAAGHNTEITNSTFDAPSNAAYRGSAIALMAGTAPQMRILHSMIRGATGPFLLYRAPAVTTPITLINTIVTGSDSAGPLCNSPAANGGGNLLFGSANPASCGATIPVADPILQALAGNGGLTRTMALSAGSPAIDAAVAA